MSVPKEADVDICHGRGLNHKNAPQQSAGNVSYVVFALIYALDDSILDVDVGVDRLVIVDYPPPFDQQLVTLLEEYRERKGKSILTF